MNIFVLDPSPTIAATYLCDQHLNKMLLESTQLLCNSVHALFRDMERSSPSTHIYREIQLSHPCSLWLLESQENCIWLFQYIEALEHERVIRFPHSQMHASCKVALEAQFCLDHVTNEAWEERKQTNFVQVMPYEYMIPDNPVLGYQRYYRAKRRSWELVGRTMTWTGRNIPLFMTKTLEVAS